MGIIDVRTVNVAELKNRLGTYLTDAKSGEVIVIHDRNLPVAKLIPFTAADASELALVFVSSDIRLSQAAARGVFGLEPEPGCSVARALLQPTD